jgi:hypothetical protein
MALCELSGERYTLNWESYSKLVSGSGNCPRLRRARTKNRGVAAPYRIGRMFWLNRKTLVGS